MVADGHLVEQETAPGEDALQGRSAGRRLGPAPTSSQATNYWLPYTVVDAFLTYEVSDNVKLDLNVENVFDRYYIDALDGWMPAPGRTIRASMTASF